MSLEIFISYARADGIFADRLLASLKTRGYAVTLDRNDIDKFEAWRLRIRDLIASTDTMLFLVSPQALASNDCLWELEVAAEFEKRIAPVLVDPTTQMTSLPKAIAPLNILVEFTTDPWDVAMDLMDQQLRQDLSWIRQHTQYTRLATQWQGSQDASRLLRGAALREAELWLAKSDGHTQPASALLRDFIAASFAELSFTSSEILEGYRTLLDRRPAEQKWLTKMLNESLSRQLPLEPIETAFRTKKSSADLYVDLLETAAPDEAILYWTRLAELCGKFQTWPPRLTASSLLSSLFNETNDQIALSICNLLKHTPLNKAESHMLSCWVDPFGEPRCEHSSRWPQLRGAFDVLGAALEVLFRSMHCDPTALFGGDYTFLASDAAWWRIYFEKLIDLSRTGELCRRDLDKRLQMAVRAAQTDTEQLLALAQSVSQALDGSVPVLTVCRLLEETRRQKFPQKHPDLYLSLIKQLITPNTAQQAFLLLMSSAGEFASDPERRDHAGRLLGQVIQTETDLVEVLDRFLRERHTPLKGMMALAVASTPLTIDAKAVSNALEPTQGSPTEFQVIDQILAALDEEKQMALLQSLTDKNEVFTLPKNGTAIFVLMLCAEISAFGRTCPREAEAALLTLIMEAAQHFKTKPDFSPFQSAVEAVRNWAEVLRQQPISQRKRLEAAEGLSAQVRWFRARLAMLPNADQKGAVKLLEHQVRAFLAEFPDIFAATQVAGTSAFGVFLCDHPIVTSLKLLLEKEEIVALGQRSDRILRPSDVQDFIACLDTVTALDKTAKYRHQAQCVDLLIDETIALMADHGSGDAGHFLMTCLHRKDWTILPDRSYAHQEKNIARGLALTYRENPSWLIEPLATAVLEETTKLSIFTELYRETGAGEAQILELLTMRDLAGEAQYSDAVKSLRGRPYSEALRHFCRNLPPMPSLGLSTLAADVLLSSDAAEDKLTAIRYRLQEQS